VSESESESESEASRDRPEPVRPAAPRREVAPWEYWTAYIQHFQVRMPVGLHDRLCQWAKQEHKLPVDLLIETLEEAVRQRGV